MVNKNLTWKLGKDSDIPELETFLKMVEKIVYKYFYNHNDNTLKYFDFTN